LKKQFSYCEILQNYKFTLNVITRVVNILLIKQCSGNPTMHASPPYDHRLSTPYYVFILFIFLVVTLWEIRATAAPIEESLARKVAGNLLIHLHAENIIVTVEDIESSGQKVGYLVTLSPNGYILVAANDIKVPIKGYSLSSTFYALPEPYRTNILQELEVSDISRKTLAPQDNANAPYWTYLQKNTPDTLRKNYFPDTYLLSTEWGQRAPFNNYMPLLNGENTVTGCVQTAIAQIMRYHKHPAIGSGVFQHAWNDQNLTAVMNRPFNWENMPSIFTSDTPQYMKDEIAALMRDLGIFNKANFGLSSTSAAFNFKSFDRAFGYAPIAYQKIGSSITSINDFFSTIRNEIDNLRPVVLEIPNHLTIADGYASDSTGRKIHVNMGWEGAYDNYYYLDQTIIAGGNLFAPSHTIYYNIKPCSGGECRDSYPNLQNEAPPVISYPPQSIAINTPTKMRIDAYDPDGDTVTVSASSTCSGIQASVMKNVVTVTPLAPNLLCKINIIARSDDGVSAEAFNILTINSNSNAGQQYEITGQFASKSEEDTYSAYLGGATVIRGDRGYSNQAFFISVKDSFGRTLVAPTDASITGTFVPAYYTITASLTRNFTSYLYDQNFSNYSLSITNESTIEEIAATMGITQPSCNLNITTEGSGKGQVISQPAKLECSETCSSEFVCGSELILSAVPANDTVFTQWSDDCIGNNSSLLIALTDDTTCSARFSLDADQDKMPDDWEIQYGLNPEIDDSMSDMDGDGTTNIAEYRNGTPPNIRIGDLNGDNNITLTDALLAMKVITGGFTTNLQTLASVNDTNRLGLIEAIFCLRKVAGL
jgi:hypothetical protein